MNFIGIVSDEKSENAIRRYLLEKLNMPESSILFIKEKSIENIKNIKFETILITREFKNVQLLKKLLENTKYLILNSDIKGNLNILKDINITVISYGFNSKSTLTVSSVSDDKLILCLQRNIININGKEIESQELEMLQEENINITMGIVSILILYGKML